MNTLRLLSFGLLLFYLISACGEDRTYEYKAKTERNHWIMDVMKERYLWADSIKEDKVDWQKFFIAPASFMENLIAFAPIKDNWSWCSVDTMNEDHYQRGYFNHFDSYGLDFIMMTDPTRATSRQFARVMSVIKDSPADRCGLERGDFIVSVDGMKMTTSNTDKLVSGKKRTLEVYKLDVNEDATEYIWTEEKTIEMDRSEYVEDVAFPLVKSFDVKGIKVGYIMCNRLCETPYVVDEGSEKYKDELKKIILNLKTVNPQIMILDFRLCNCGSIDMADLLASYMLNTSFQSEIFAQTIFNKHRNDDNYIYYFNTEALNDALNATDVFCITGDYTEGAAEWVIRGLTCVLGEDHVFKIGKQTLGQCVLTEDVKSDYYVTLHPAVAFVADKYGDYDYYDGLETDLEINESLYLKLYPYGNENEVLLASVLNEIYNMF